LGTLTDALTPAEQAELLGGVTTKQEQGRESKERRSQAEILLDLATLAGFFHDQEREPYAVIPVAGHREIWPVRSKYFKWWLVGAFYEATGKAVNTDALNQALNALEHRAVFRSPRMPLHLRIAEHGGAFWYDLADATWRAVKITPDGWEVVEKPPILFRRYQNTAAQVEPERGGTVWDLFALTNVKKGRDKLLLAVYLVTVLVPDIPRPILNVFGEKGSGKSTLMRMARQLIDPAVEPLLIPRSNERDMCILLAHNFAPFFDNLSGVSAELSAMLCRAATGAGFTARQLYTDADEVILKFKRAVGVNGIHLLTGGTDLQDRFLTIELERVPADSRRQEQEILREFERRRPRLFGAMLDALSAAMGIKPKLRFNRLPRMADFAAWGAAVAEALGVGADEFLNAYFENIGELNERIVASHPVAHAVACLLDECPEWIGTPSALLEKLEEIAAREKLGARSRAWPGSSETLTKRLKELVSNLADVGIEVEFGKDSAGYRGRWIALRKADQKGTKNGVARVATVANAEIASASRATPPATPDGGRVATVANASQRETSNGAAFDGSDGSDAKKRTLLGEDLEELDWPDEPLPF